MIVNMFTDYVRSVPARVRRLQTEHPGLLRYAALLALVVLMGAAARATRERLAVSPLPEDRPATAAALASEQPAPVPTPEARHWCRPAPGRIIGAYAPDGAVWSETLGQWQSHPGIDIDGAPGEVVCACGDGTVRDAYVDRLWGNVIVIDHADGYVSTYAALNTLEMARAGETVKMGDVIGAIGRSADCEAALEWHLHFSLTKDGAPVDFEALLADGA